MTAADPRPEFSRLIRADRVGREPKHRRIEASPAECARLAERLGVAELRRLVADVALQRHAGGRIDLTGELEAELVQLCVVSLEAVAARVGERFLVEFIDSRDGAEPAVAESVISLVAGDPPEPVRDGVIDVGEAVVQQLAVAIDPYPRAPGAVAAWPGQESEAAVPEDRRRPFTGLGSTRKTGGNL